MSPICRVSVLPLWPSTRRSKEKLVRVEVSEQMSGLSSISAVKSNSS